MLEDLLQKGEKHGRVIVIGMMPQQFPGAIIQRTESLGAPMCPIRGDLFLLTPEKSRASDGLIIPNH